MARLVLVISKSGTGKSSSLRNLKKGEASVILCSGKELPFRSDISTMVPKSHLEVVSAIERANAPIVVIDDANYLMSFEEMSRVNEVGYTKFTQMAQHMFEIFQAIIKKDSDQTFYVMAHAADTEDGSIRFKTTGKMLSEKVVLEGLTNILITNEITSDGEFVFKVRTDGTGVKTPLGMFNTEVVPNDLKIVDEAIRKYFAPVKPAKEAK
jgi:NAD kinase